MFRKNLKPLCLLGLCVLTAPAWSQNAASTRQLVNQGNYWLDQGREDLAADTWRKLLAADPNIKVVFRDMPVLGPESERFAMAALSAAKQGKYPQFYRAAFSGQGPLSESRLIAAVPRLKGKPGA